MACCRCKACAPVVCLCVCVLECKLLPYVRIVAVRTYSVQDTHLIHYFSARIQYSALSFGIHTCMGCAHTHLSMNDIYICVLSRLRFLRVEINSTFYFFHLPITEISINWLRASGDVNAQHSHAGACISATVTMCFRAAVIALVCVCVRACVGLASVLSQHFPFLSRVTHGHTQCDSSQSCSS